MRSIKKGKSSEQILAADLMTLTFVQIGYSTTDAIQFLNECKPTLLELIEDDKCEPEVRAACIRTLAMGVFITNDGATDTISILEKLESLFSGAYAKGDGTLRVFTPKMYELYSSALSMWCLLLFIMPLPFVNRLSQK